MQHAMKLRGMLLKCLGATGGPDSAPAMRPPTVTFLQRKASSRRSFLNLPEIRLELSEKMPGVKFQVGVS
jgi:hypothetical protein